MQPLSARRLAALVLIALLATPAWAGEELKAWLEWVNRVDMRVVENGVIEEVAVKVGQHVDKGDLLLRMDQREAKARLLQTRARVARAQVATEKAQRDLDRAQELFDRGLIATEELKDAELARLAASAEEEAAKAAEEAAAVALERTELRAPFSGIVVQRNAWNGAVIYKTLQQEPLIVLAPDDRMLARALVTAETLRRFRPGQKVRVRVDGAMRDASIYSLGVESVRVERDGAVYYLDAIFDRKQEELLRPSERVQILTP